MKGNLKTKLLTLGLAGSAFLAPLTACDDTQAEVPPIVEPEVDYFESVEIDGEVNPNIILPDGTVNKEGFASALFDIFKARLINQTYGDLHLSGYESFQPIFTSYDPESNKLTISGFGVYVEEGQIDDSIYGDFRTMEFTARLNEIETFEELIQYFEEFPDITNTSTLALAHYEHVFGEGEDDEVDKKLIEISRKFYQENVPSYSYSDDDVQFFGKLHVGESGDEMVVYTSTLHYDEDSEAIVLYCNKVSIPTTGDWKENLLNENGIEIETYDDTFGIGANNTIVGKVNEYFCNVSGIDYTGILNFDRGMLSNLDKEVAQSKDWVAHVPNSVMKDIEK